MYLKKLFLTGACMAAMLTAAVPAAARDTVHFLPIEAALDANDARNRLGDSIKFYFGDQKTPAIAARLGSSAVASMRRIKHQLVVNRDGDDGQPLGD